MKSILNTVSYSSHVRYPGYRHLVYPLLPTGNISLIGGMPAL